jgi:hypothetical protein
MTRDLKRRPLIAHSRTGSSGEGLGTSSSALRLLSTAAPPPRNSLSPSLQSPLAPLLADHLPLCRFFDADHRPSARATATCVPMLSPIGSS